MKEPTIEQLFPTPIMFNNIQREFTTDELNFVKQNSTKTIDNPGNISSSEKYILNNKVFSNLKKFIQDNIEYYVNTIYKPTYPIKPYITQSWLNWTKPGEFHHPHNHPNSFISGVLYINTDGEKDKITFYKTDYEQISLRPNDFNMYNAKSWWFNVKPGDLIIFPSCLLHDVEKVTTIDTRISLAFNTFLKGTIGDNMMAMELIIE
jgi:uncharacterized protein (TIGR02466 family)